MVDRAATAAGRREREVPGVSRQQKVAASKHGMIATAHSRATAAGVEILEAGGNAVDAAVAAAFALGVCEPQASGLGGQTMLLVHQAEPRRTFVLDGSSRAPNRASVDLLKPRARRLGYRATTVPSTPAVLAYALETYGTIPLSRALAPAIRVAKDGFEVSELFHFLSRRALRELKAGTAAPFYLRDGVRAYRPGQVLKQPVLAATLSRLARKGVADFYTGRIARRIHRDMVKNDGFIRHDDLAQIPWPIERKAVRTRFQGLRVATLPPPGAGRVLIEMLNIIDQFPPRRWNPERPGGALRLAQVMQQAAMDRRDRPFDPNFFPQVEKKMLSKEYAEEIARAIRKRIRTQGETTHLSVMDRYGNAVALTQSIERVFGSCAAAPDLGFLYNNYMSSFDYDDMSHPYAMRPNAVPWANVAPTILFRGSRPWMTIGSPGSERIVTAVLQVVLRVIAGQSLYDAVSSPRLHCSVEGRVSLEGARFRDDILRTLQHSGFELDVRDPFSFYLGCVQAVMRDAGTFVGVADPRRDGSAGGPMQ